MSILAVQPSLIAPAPEAAAPEAAPEAAAAIRFAPEAPWRRWPRSSART